MNKIFIFYEKTKLNWIVERLSTEWINKNNDIYTTDINEATIIWLFSYYMIDKFKKNILNLIKKKKLKVIVTMHHISTHKHELYVSRIKKLDKIVSYYHSICTKTTNDLKKYTNKPIRTVNLWCNDELWHPINISTENLRLKYSIPNDKYIIGSFQNDTEGYSIKSESYLPKLEKGSDLLIKIYHDISKTKDIHIVLTGSKRHYIIQQLEKLNINYTYLGLVEINKLNEIYRTLDLYIVSSRTEGGPYSIFEASLCKIPLISTDVGIVSNILHKKSIFDANNYLTYKQAIPDVDHAYNNCKNFNINTYMAIFNKQLFDI